MPSTLKNIFKIEVGNFQWLELSDFTAMFLGSVPGQGAKIPQTKWCSRKKTKKKKKCLKYKEGLFLLLK